MVRDVARDRLVAPCGVAAATIASWSRSGSRRRAAEPLLAARGVVLPRELPGRLDRLRAARDEEDAVEVARSERCHLAPRARSRAGARTTSWCRRAARASARARPGRSPRRTVADVDREQPGERVEVALAVRVLEVAPVAADDDRHLLSRVPAHPREVHPEVVLRELLEVERGLGHAASVRGSGSGIGTAAGIGSRARRARSPQSTLPIMTSTATRKIALAIDVHLRRHGNARRAPDEERERRRRPGDEVRDHEVVDREREPEQRRAEDRRREQRQRDLAGTSSTRSRRGPSRPPRGARSKSISRAFTVTTT